MLMDYGKLEQEVIEKLNKSGIGVLATCHQDYVTARPMSIINEKLNIYFQTNECYIKHQQMKNNENIALCIDNMTFEGVAHPIGNWKDEKNKMLLEKYYNKHQSSFEAYGLLDRQVVYEINVKRVRIWAYENGKPIRKVLEIDTHKAELLDFMD